MLKQAVAKIPSKPVDDSFDDLMAGLMVLITHHSLTQCQNSLPSIVDRLKRVCTHSDLEHYPEQMLVLAKMRQLWETKLFEIRLDSTRH